MDELPAAESWTGDQPRTAAEREVILELQRAMLPAGLPVLPELSMAAGYAPAEGPGAPGGDWFDVVPLPGGAVGLVGGDAIGQGASAVAAMGQLRAVAAERLLRGTGLEEVVLALDAFARRVSRTRGSTVCVAVVEPRTGSVRYSVRGHPPPLVVAADGSTRYLTASSGPPLALVRDHYRLADDRLKPGETLVLYSNGAVERPGRSIGQGMIALASRVGEVVRRHETRDRGLADAVCAAVTGRRGDEGEQSDDVSVVVVTRLPAPPPPLAITVPALPDRLGVVRRQFSGWLRGFQASEDDMVALELSAVEAVTNSIEHAFAEAPGEVRVTARLDDDGVIGVLVSDNGRWKPPTADPGFRGRGLVMMREFSDDLRVHPSEHGTTVRITKALYRPVSLDGALPVRAPQVVRTELEIDTRVEPDEVVIAVAGMIDSSNIEVLQASLIDARRHGSRPLTIVLDLVTLLASAGLRVLYEHIGNLLSARQSVRLVATLASPIRGVLAVSGLDRLVEVAAEV
ncbi:MAG: SpoIIE family protein phosphatase [Labedaea sp.]